MLSELIDTTRLSQWVQRLGDLAVSRATLEATAFQLALIAAVLLAAWGIRRLTRSWTDRFAERLEHRLPRYAFIGRLRPLALPLGAWALLAITGRVANQFAIAVPLIAVAASLTALWTVLRGTSVLLRDALLARLIASAAWIIAALDILGLLAPTAAALDSLALTVGTLRLSVLLVLKGAAILTILLWGALGLARLASSRIVHLASVSPSVQVLATNLLKIALVSMALLIGLNAVGIDLTAFAVLSGAIGVGVGFGLQKIVSNFVSGIILLLERSIKPGDVIEVGKTYGWITSLGARYVSVRGRDGKEYLIPNEDLITHTVTNWSFSSPQVRIDAEFGVSYDTDLHAVRDLATEAARHVKRVIASPAPVCHVTGFGDNAITLLLRFWIDDPMNGVTNVRGAVMLALWETFREHGIELPFPQREIRLREIPREIEAKLARRDAAE